MPQARTKTFGLNSHRFGKMVRLLEDDDKFSSRSQSGYQESGGRSPSVYFDTVDSTNIYFGPIKDCVSSSSPLLALDQPHISTSVRNVVAGRSDESGSEFDTGSWLVSGSNGLIRASERENPPVSCPVDELVGNRDDAMIAKSEGSSRSRALSKHTVGWRDQYMVQLPRLHDSIVKNIVDEYPQRVSTTYERASQKGSSSKAPQTHDLTEPLLLNKKSRPIVYKAVEVESEDHAVISVDVLGSKTRHSSGRRTIHSIGSGTEGLSRRKGNSHTYDARHARFEETGAGHRDSSSNGASSSRRVLSNLACSSAADVLPSVSSSTLSNLACVSAVDVLPSVANTVSGSSYLRPRRSSRSLGLDGETSRRLQPLKRQVEEAKFLSMREIPNGVDQAPYSPDQGAHQSGGAPYIHASRPEHFRTDFLSSETSMASSTSASTLLPPNHRHWRRNEALSRNGDGSRIFHRSSSSFIEANSPLGEEFPNVLSYGNRTHSLAYSRFSNRNLYPGRPSHSSRSILREIHYPQSRFLGPLARPPPLPPVAGLTEPSPSENDFIAFHPPSIAAYSSTPSSFDLPTTEHPSATVMAETGSLNRPMNNGEGRLRLTVEGLSEGSMQYSLLHCRLPFPSNTQILSALEHVERDEALSYEQILMLEATILLGGIGLHDRYRDMRIDIDNMSYEDLLALEERIGYVNTGLGEESVRKTVRVKIFTAPEVSCDYVPQEIEIKCSICQEEFEESVELGVLDCGHSHHIACIKQWLLQKNQCPICKAPAMPSL